MKRMRGLLGMFMIAAVLFTQTGCMFLAGKAAVEGGKMVYKKLKADKAKNEQADQDKQE